MALASFIIYDHFKDKPEEIKKSEETKIVDKLNLEYLNVYLTNDNRCFLIPFNKEEINNLKTNKNLQDRLNLLYDKASYFKIYDNGYEIKGYEVKVDSKINKIYAFTKDNNTYVIFLKENNKIAILDTEKYIDDLDTEVIDNYNDYKDVLEIQDDNLIYLDGSNEVIKIN